MHGVKLDSFYPVEETSGVPTSNNKLKLWWLPEKLRAFLRLTILNKKLTKKIDIHLSRDQYDLIIIRHETVRLDFSLLRRKHPKLKIAIELNAFLGDELFTQNWVKRIVKHYEISQINAADRVFPVSSILRSKLIENGITENKIVINPNGVDKKRFNKQLLSNSVEFREKYAIPADKFVIGYVGGMEKYRRLPELAHSFIMLNKNQLKDKIFLFMVGDGQDFEEIRAILNKESKNEDYKLLGWQKHEEVPEIMATFDLALMPYTLDYCSPLKLFEYLAMGLPTIGPDTPSVRDLFQDKKHLYLNHCDDDVDQLIEKLYLKPDERSRISKEGFSFVMENYTWRSNAERIVNNFTQ